MSDERLREAERRWKETGSVDDEARYLLERVRVGDLTPERLAFAASYGHEGAIRAHGGAAIRPNDCLEALAPLGYPMWTMAANALVARAMEEAGQDSGLDGRLSRAIRIARLCGECRCERHARRAWIGAREAERAASEYPEPQSTILRAAALVARATSLSQDRASLRNVVLAGRELGQLLGHEGLESVIARVVIDPTVALARERPRCARQPSPVQPAATLGPWRALGLRVGYEPAVAAAGEDWSVVLETDSRRWIGSFEEFGAEVAVRVALASIEVADPTAQVRPSLGAVSLWLDGSIQQRTAARHLVESSLATVDPPPRPSGRDPFRLLRSAHALLRSVLGPGDAQLAVSAALLAVEGPGDFRTAVSSSLLSWLQRVTTPEMY